MRILVTNDDGVHAPGLAALTRALAGWAEEGPPGENRQVLVVAPLANYSGASSAVGTVYEREAIAYRAVAIEGAEKVPTFGLDASPALSAIVACLGGFGSRPDLIISGINLGVNVGRSILHSGTVGAALTAAQFGLSGLAVSMRAGQDPERWDTAAHLAVELVPVLAAAPARTVLNLNVPSMGFDQLRGIRRGRVSTAGLIQAATDSVRREPTVAGSGRDEGEIHLTLGAAVPTLGDVGDEEPDDDGALVHAGFACVTSIVGVREDNRQEADEVVRAALARLSPRLGDPLRDQGPPG